MLSVRRMTLGSVPDIPRPEVSKPCGKCGNCQRALSQAWIDFQEISADVEEGATGSVKIDQFRELKETLGFGAMAGTYRITLIRDADRMTPQAAN